MLAQASSFFKPFLNRRRSKSSVMGTSSQMGSSPVRTALERAGKSKARIAIIGDVHGNWHEQRDILALKLLQPDIVIFVGDFGEENVALVRSISRVQEQLGEDAAVAVILGNHDAWRSMFGNAPSSIAQGRKPDLVQQQLDLLGSSHIGFGRMDLPQFRLSLVGARPFSYGPSSWAQEFYRRRFGVSSLRDSAERIAAAAAGAPEGHAIVFVGHNGPAGLGSSPHDICGKDFPSKRQGVGGDFGDSDFASAIHNARRDGRHVPLVVFGHMHHILWGDRMMLNSGGRNERSSRRTMTKVDEERGTAYVNAAVVPRILSELQFEEEAEMMPNSSEELLAIDPDTREELMRGGEVDGEFVGVSNTVHHFTCVEVSLTSQVHCSLGVDAWVRVVEGEHGVGGRCLKASIARQVVRHELATCKSYI